MKNVVTLNIKVGVKMIGYGGDERSPNHPKKCPNERERERERERQKY